MIFEDSAVNFPFNVYKRKRIKKYCILSGIMTNNGLAHLDHPNPKFVESHWLVPLENFKHLYKAQSSSHTFIERDSIKILSLPKQNILDMTLPNLKVYNIFPLGKTPFLHPVG